MGAKSNADGVAEGFGYDTNRLQLASQTATKGAASLMNLTYNYQASTGQMGAGTNAGNAGQLMAISGTINATTESAAYTYDLLGRLGTSNQTSNGASGQRRFAYDRWGNRSGVWDAVSGGNQIQTIALQQSGGAPTNRITSVTSGSTVNYTYDAAGNVTNDGVHTYTYDAENRVVSVDGGATAQYQYDHQNRRVSKIIGSSWTHYVWQGSQVIAEHDATTLYQATYAERSARVDYIYSGSRMISSRERASAGGAWTTKYYLSDRLSTRLVLNASGNVLGRQAHLPFGEDFGESGTQEKHHFTSYERDGESGLDYAVNRGYSPGTGRFRQADPYRASGYMIDPRSWNRYSYTRNNPVSSVDPLGLEDNPEYCSPDRQDCPDIYGRPGVSGGVYDHPSRYNEGGGSTSPTVPEPAASKCDINARISGASRSGISPVSDINSDSRIRLGPHEHAVADGYWFFFFEVSVILPRGTSPAGWRFNQSVLRIESFTINWNGTLISDRVRFEDLTDQGLAESPLYSRTAGGVHYWIDTPGVSKRRSVKLNDGSSVRGPVVSLLTTWEFEWTATYTADPRRSCSKRFRLSLTYENGVPSWTHSFPQ